jgi:hypothetical protein
METTRVCQHIPGDRHRPQLAPSLPGGVRWSVLPPLSTMLQVHAHTEKDSSGHVIF